MKNVAIVLAGGTGSRMGGEMPKQFFKVRGTMLIEYAIDAFERNALIDEIAVVSHEKHLDEVMEIVRRNGWKKVRHILKGGKERYDSSLSAIRAYEAEDVNLIFHDAARPLVSQRIITDVVETLRRAKACGVAVPCVDTILVCQDGYIQAAPDRSTLRRAQTPQGFDIAVIRRAYERGMSDPHFKATDDCGIVLKYCPEVPVSIVEGEEANMKVTYKDDLRLLEMYLND